jgi:hypothetical protein
MTEVYSRRFFAVRALLIGTLRQKQFAGSRTLNPGTFAPFIAAGLAGWPGICRTIHFDVNPTVAWRTDMCIAPVRLEFER